VEDCAYTMLLNIIKWSALDSTGSIKKIKICLNKEKDTYVSFKQFYDAILKQDAGEKLSTKSNAMLVYQEKKV
jgi:hypothetical protein